MVALMMTLCYNGNGILKTRKLMNVQRLDAERKTPHKNAAGVKRLWKTC